MLPQEEQEVRRAVIMFRVSEEDEVPLTRLLFDTNGVLDHLPVEAITMVLMQMEVENTVMFRENTIIFI